jgi:hypothetical protein
MFPYQMVVLFWEAWETLEDETQVEEVGHRKQAL